MSASAQLQQIIALLGTTLVPAGGGGEQRDIHFDIWGVGWVVSSGVISVLVAVVLIRCY